MTKSQIRTRKRKEAGLCQRCGKNQTANVRCSECQLKHQQKARNWVSTKARLRPEWWGKTEPYRQMAIAHYSNNTNQCACCKEPDVRFLTIVHINNDGAEHRKRGGKAIYIWLFLHNYPVGFQILCWNCNLGKSIYGTCPHNLPINTTASGEIKNSDAHNPVVGCGHHLSLGKGHADAPTGCAAGVSPSFFLRASRSVSAVRAADLCLSFSRMSWVGSAGTL